jgi:2-haloalkanoic acid dehalogenase type II
VTAGTPSAAPPAHPAPDEIRVVAFDCYGTLLDFEERSFAPAIDVLLLRHSVDHTDGETVWKEWMEHAREHDKKYGRDPDKPLAGPEPPFFSFAETWTQHFDHAFDSTSVQGIDPEHATGYMFELLAQAPPYEEVGEVLTGLRARGLRLLVASNADDAHLEPALARTGILEHVEIVISSEAVRSYKPRRPFFDAIAERAGVEPHQIVYVGDSPYSDVTGARNAGMASYWVRRYSDEEREKHLHHDPTWRFPDLCGLLGVLMGGER